MHRLGSAVWKWALWSGIVAASWLGMQVVHECGHVIGAVTSGGRVTHVELKPWTISRTDVEPNPRPLVERWAGPIAGCVLPVSAWLAVRPLRLPWAYLLRFFAGFCLIANGAYLGVGAAWPVGDAADILRIEPSRWPLAVFGILTVICGLLLWHRLGTNFGIGPHAATVNVRHAMGVWCVAGAIVLLESML
ncbi:MAG: hypothetical protein JNG89_09795 [Planctomycetaceae bacterium]|nr:hypothetical protein [Planctomycetaceae bacterium]